MDKERGKGDRGNGRDGTRHGMVATTPVHEPELTVEVGDRPTTGHLEDTVLYSV